MGMSADLQGARESLEQIDESPSTAQCQRVGQTGEPAVSIVMPCLNEADTVGTCVRKAQIALRECDLAGEIVVADNGSSDGSQDIAHALGARVIGVTGEGYGQALMGGIAAARGKYIVIGDADDSYD